MTVRHFVTGASVFAIAVSSQVAGAQSTTVPAATAAEQISTPADAASPQTDTPADGIGDIVVTAQRRNESLQKRTARYHGDHWRDAEKSRRR